MFRDKAKGYCNRISSRLFTLFLLPFSPLSTPVSFEFLSLCLCSLPLFCIVLPLLESFSTLTSSTPPSSTGSQLAPLEKNLYFPTILFLFCSFFSQKSLRIASFCSACPFPSPSLPVSLSFIRNLILSLPNCNLRNISS